MVDRLHLTHHRLGISATWAGTPVGGATTESALSTSSDEVKWGVVAVAEAS